MKSTIGIAFISFDFNKGPLILYSENVPEDFCNLLALKVVVTGLSTNNNNDLKSYYAESIIPFPNEEKIVFSYLFPITSNENSEPRSSALSLVVPISEKYVLYSTAHQLSKIFRKFATELQAKYVYPLELNTEFSNSLIELTNPNYLASLA